MCNPTEATQDPFVARVLAGATRAELKAEFNLSSDAVYRRLRRIKEKGISASPATAHKVWSD
ncbi:MAG: helix-turn-helix domain-containing protein, partial [Ktedonobacteraceae bacterium]|nr:helix-turn-helix domain-containing protein [Ktedonobacteraceae bacterium]